jgi:Domain of unknown function (DUF5018)
MCIIHVLISNCLPSNAAQKLTKLKTGHFMLKKQRFLPISGLLTSALLGLLSACGSSDSTPAASDLKAEFSIHGVSGTINGKQVTVDLTSKEACSDISALVTGINTGGATISPDPSVARNYSAPVDFTLTFPDGTKVVYTVTVKSNECVVPTPTPAPTPPPVATPTPTPTPTPAPTPYVPPTLPSSLPDINVGDNGGSSPISFTISMPALNDANGNQIAYSVSGLPLTDVNAPFPISWNVIQSGANLLISGLYSGAGLLNTIHTYPLLVSSINATGSTSVSLNIQTN